jgi:hypothetical protein
VGVRAAPEPAAAAFRAGTGRQGDRALAEDQRPRPSALECANPAVQQSGGLELDFCGIAKGFAVDWAVRKLQAAGWAAGMLEIGGELRSWGRALMGGPGRCSWARAVLPRPSRWSWPAGRALCHLRRFLASVHAGRQALFAHAGSAHGLAGDA